MKRKISLFCLRASIYTASIFCLGGLLLGCGQAIGQEAKPPPYILPLFDGKPNATKTPPAGEYKLAPLPNAKELFDMVVACWPEKSWLRAELSAEARVQKKISDSTTSNTSSFDPVTGQYTTTTGGNGTDKYVGLTFRIPLFSAMELDREREREIGRRVRISEGVGEFISALAEWQMTDRELALMKSLEKRAQERVELGVSETSEQVKYMERVAALDRNTIGQKAKLIKARVVLQGMCDERKSWVIDEYLKRFKEIK